MFTVTPFVILSTRLALFPLIASIAGPGPTMARFFVITSSLLVSVIVPLVPKRIVSAGCAFSIAWRSEPAPESPRVVTVNWAGVVKVWLPPNAEPNALLATQRKW